MEEPFVRARYSCTAYRSRTLSHSPSDAGSRPNTPHMTDLIGQGQGEGQGKGQRHGQGQGQGQESQGQGQGQVQIGQGQEGHGQEQVQRQVQGEAQGQGQAQGQCQGRQECRYTLYLTNLRKPCVVLEEFTESHHFPSRHTLLGRSKSLSCTQYFPWDSIH